MANLVATRPTAIVTGALRGIGRECAIALSKSGFNVLLNDLAVDDHTVLAQKLIAEVEESGAESIVFGGDVSDLDEHTRLIEAASARWGRIDCLVNNAGVGVAKRGDLLDVTSESFDRCLRVNTKAVFFLSQAVARHMLKQGEIRGQYRSIINITSSNAVAVSISRGEYCVSKCASSMTTRLFGVRLAGEGIGVYEVRPGIIDTDMTRPVKDKYDALIADSVPAQRWGLPADVAATVRSMAEGHLSYTVGQAVTVDGGLTIPRF
ncbi:3-ketoacyl-ACP reductase [Caballeronia mineralivorans]|jgi:3-oxoacyl-[acyl-carrier protein] reductase|uniref:3-ketoacyl-ACP reductase n=1 Tax=Caballeronia mineralivorans TaxID=2010198 RepID=UPI002AFF5FE0|nr:3-ketoacyl-ACP reductase [Caballeronia mineralivorans]MEA3105162.1 3-oxoacyl-[acyl-carrier protein] reductase [Caballeronia mineralivorans]